MEYVLLIVIFFVGLNIGYSIVSETDTVPGLLFSSDLATDLSVCDLHEN